MVTKRLLRAATGALMGLLWMHSPSSVAAPSYGARSISVGYAHSCLVDEKGAVYCWGANHRGQLGNGSLVNRRTATPVTGLSSGVAQVVVGDVHSCALMAAGTVKCWGQNYNGELGNGFTDDSPLPVDVVGLSSVRVLSAAGNRSCVINTSQEVLCWGFGGSGELGVGTIGAVYTTPIAMQGLPAAVRTIGLGSWHTCVVLVTGRVMCTGYNAEGQLGDGTTTRRALPVAVDALGEDILDFAAGFGFSCALTVNSKVKCWGTNQQGQLGNPQPASSMVPVDVPVAGPIQRLVGSMQNVCALLVGGDAYCWGFNGTGALGNYSNQDNFSPAHVGLSNIAEIAVGSGHSCAVTRTGEAFCWGSNASGQMGTGTPYGRNFPEAVNRFGHRAEKISAGMHTCAQVGDGLKCWGRNDDGQLGDNSVVDRHVPTDVLGIPDPIQNLSAGIGHSCATSVLGQAYCWGANAAGQLGTGDTSVQFTPVPVPDLVVRHAVAGQFHTCVLTTMDVVACWGGGGNGQLGVGSTSDSLVPVYPTPFGQVKRLSTSRSHNCVVTHFGAAYCWGYNGNGQVGNGETTDVLVPTVVSGFPDGSVIEITAGHTHSCAVTINGGAKCWGFNGSGELGDGTVAPQRLTPVSVAGLNSGVIAIEAGDSHSCALIYDGTVKCWGANAFGQLGDGSTTDRRAPVTVAGLPNAAAISAGPTHTCAITFENAIWCWGSNQAGELGNNTTVSSPVPVLVYGFLARPVLTADATRVLPGAPVQLTVTDATMSLSGPVRFLADFAPIPGCDAVPFAMGVARCTTSFTVIAPHDVTAVFDGSATQNPFVVRLGGMLSVPAVTIVVSSTGMGSTTPTGSQAVLGGTNLSISLAPATGYAPVVIGTCAGSLMSSNYVISPVDRSCTVQVQFGLLLRTLEAAASRQVHAGIPLDLPIQLAVPVTGRVTVEPRTLGGGLHLVMRFSGALFDAGTAIAKGPDGQPIPGATVSTSIGPSGDEVLVTVSGLSDAQRVAIEMSGVNGAYSANATLAVFRGDVNGDLIIDDLDVRGVRAQLGNAATPSTARFDINRSGWVTASDLLAVRARRGLSMP